MTRTIAAAALLAFLVSCSKDQTVDSKQTQSPSEPMGAIVGRVTSMTTGQPLVGATVSVPSPVGISSAPTDATGTYLIGGLPAGAVYQVRFAAAGYVAAFGTANIPAAAGTFPSNGIAEVDMVLAEANATLNGHVYERNGAPAGNVVLMVDLRNRGFDFVATATTNAQGAYSLTGLPGAPTGLTVPVVAQPWDADRDGLADYDSVTRTAVTYPGATSLLDFDLRVAPAALLLLTSNLESGSLDPSAQIRLVFNRELDATLTIFSLYDSTAAKTVAMSTSLDPTSKILTIFPAGGTPLAANHSYSLTGQAQALNGDVLNVSRSFVTDVPVALLPPVTGLIVSPSVVDYNTVSFTLSWNLNLDASGYQVWVRDSSRNPSYLLARTVSASLWPSASVTLPSTFDYYAGDAIQTPFAFGVGVDFVVVAVNAGGDAPSPATITPEHRADTVPPTASATQVGGANNTAGASPKTVALNVHFDEYMDTSVAPTLSLPVLGETSTFAWSPDGRGGVFTITIPATTDGRGTYTISGALDSSGNAMIERSGVLTSVTQLVVNGDFEAGSLTGWTTSFTSTATAPVATSAVAATGTWSAQVGNATASYQWGYSIMYQTVTLPAGASSIVASATYRMYSSTTLLHDYCSCDIENSLGTVLAPIFFSYIPSSSSFTSVSTNITGLAGQTVRIVCETYQDGAHASGMYVDDISILATP